jgi:hypothetical protein
MVFFSPLPAQPGDESLSDALTLHLAGCLRNPRSDE